MSWLKLLGKSGMGYIAKGVLQSAKAGKGHIDKGYEVGGGESPRRAL
jgi:hypothetical protein